ncbi:FecR domain-containing protein [Fibrobacter sp. UWH4]|uniref:FecR family protein n=1 Tax=Fibrobacter sp. UWH4 TaxID=1896210 RepID=UPI000922C46E|nr:FecR family protein [Fibrobacter sp. UWH4]SHK34388.1 FecR family protein [Fibrobacter sp. UWH4]
MFCSAKFFFRVAVALAVLPALSFSAPAAGKVRSTSGIVDRWKIKLNNWEQLWPGAKVYQSDLVRTGVASEVVFALPDGSSITIAENTEIELSQLLEPNDEGGFETKIDVHKGFINFAVRKQKNKKSNFKFKTGTATASIRGTEGFVGGEGMFFAGLKTGKLEIVPDGSNKMVAIEAGETTFGRDSLVVLKLASSGEKRFAERLEKILLNKSKSMGDLVREVQQADSAFQEQLRVEALALPENGFAVTSASPVNVCEQGLVLEGSYRTSDKNASLILQVGNGFVSNNLIHSADGNPHPFSQQVVVNDENGLWTVNKATLTFTGAGLTTSKSIDLKVNKACSEVNTKAPTVVVESYDSLRCSANIAINEMQNDAGIMVVAADGSPLSEDAVTKNTQKRVKLKSGKHEYTVNVEDQAGNKVTVAKTMGCYPVKRFNVDIQGGSREVLKVPPPPKDVTDRISQSLQFRIRVPDNNPENLYKVVVKQNGKVIRQELLAQIHSLDYQIPLELSRGGVNRIEVEVTHKSGFKAKATKVYEVR